MKKNHRYDLRYISNNIFASLAHGEPDDIIESIYSETKNFPKTVFFLNNKNFLGKLSSIKSNTCLTSSKFADSAKGFKNVLISDNPYLSFALLTHIFDTRPNQNNLNEYLPNKNSYISKLAKIGENVKIGNNCCIEEGVVIGDNTTIGHGVTIHFSSKIGCNCNIASGVVIGSNGFGYAKDKNTWIEIKHIGSVIIGNNVSIGANTCIDRATLDNTIIEDNVIIDNLVHIAHNVKICEGSAIAAKVGIAGSTVIGKNCQIGGMAGIFGHLNIADNVIVTPKSNVYRDIKSSGYYSSLFPLLELKLWKKTSILISKIDKISNLFKN